MKGIFSIFEKDAKKIQYFMVLFLLIYHFALFYSLSNEPVKLSDSKEYINAAQSFNQAHNFYSGNTLDGLDYRMFTKRTPFYPLVLSTLYFFNWHINYIYIFQIFLGLINIMFGFLLLKKLINFNSISVILFTVFVVLTPSQFIYSQFIMADLWLQTFVMLCAISILLFYENKKAIWLVILLFFSVLAALTKPVFLLASLVISVWCFSQFIKIKCSKSILFFALTIGIFGIFGKWFDFHGAGVK